MATMGAMSMCEENCTNAGILYELASEEMWAQWNAVANYFEYQPWIFSLIGSAMVGLSGVLPLLVIPIDEGVDLKNGAGAGTLKILLSFAVGGLLGDVFLHLLPEAWANKALNIVNADGHRPMACGLWVLTGFLVFIIAEKMFIGEGEGENAEDELEESVIDDVHMESTDGSLNNNDDEELENNNSYSKLKYSKDAEDRQSTTRSMGLKSRLRGAQNGYLIAAAEFSTDSPQAAGAAALMKNGSRSVDCSSTEEKRENGFARKPVNRTNGFIKFPANFPANNHPIVGSNGSTIGLAKNARKNSSMKQEKTDAPIKAPKAKHITGYLNLMANCIDNFTHGLAVGGSFLVSFRLGALTTFAILIHEIPHEVGDFAILLKSGFSRWDAARAQLLTASGGIIGALVAVMCSGSGIESRTSWILPFTAGGFLHIGMVTVLPELLKESNPKESAKQLGALLSGITVMAILTILCD